MVVLTNAYKLIDGVLHPDGAFFTPGIIKNRFDNEPLTLGAAVFEGVRPNRSNYPFLVIF